MQDSCVGTHMAVCFAFLLPFTHIWHFSPYYPSQTSLSPTVPPLVPPNRPRCVMLPSLCPCIIIVQHPPIRENMWCLIFCSYVSLLVMMVSRFIHVPMKDRISSFFMAAQYGVYVPLFLYPVYHRWHLGWFQVFDIVNSATLNIYVHVSLQQNDL